MMKPLKHNKIKNTAIIFEVLASKMVGEALNGDKSPAALKIIRKYFNSKSLLFKELAMYRSLMKYRENIDSENIDKYIDAVINSRKRLSESILKNLKYNVIKEMKTIYGDEFVKTGFSVPMKNYVEMASIYKLFEYDPADNPADIIESRQKISGILANKTPEKPAEISVWSEHSKDIRHVGFKFLIEKFNKKYKTLSPRQKSVLECLINHPDELKSKLSNEIKYIVGKLKEHDYDNEILKIKINELSNMINNMPLGKIGDHHISAVLRSHHLISELEEKNV